jgi:hypothetical protein
MYIYTYIWKFHKETPCVAILNKNKCHFVLIYLIKEQKGVTGAAWGVVISVREEDVWKGHVRVNIV